MRREHGDVDLVVVTNREPYSHDGDDESYSVERPVGGLTAAMDSVMRSVGGTWVAWGSGSADFAVTDADGVVAVPPGEESYDLRRVRLSDEEYADYYAGYSNQVLWPLCHHFVDRVRIAPGYWETYRTVNERFAEATVDALKATNGSNSLVWIHDYHLALAPRLVREQIGERVPIQQFWHIPWPPASVFDRCPQTDHLLAGLLGADRVGFHTEAYATNFLETVARTLPDAAVDREGKRVSYDGRVVDVYVAPVGVDAPGVRANAESQEAGRVWEGLVREHGIREEEQVVVSVDRLDYTKGIVQRLAAIEHLLERDDSLHERVRFVQKGTPTRSDIPEYERYQAEVFDRIDAINERFGTDSWEPILYLGGQYSQAAVATLYRHADVAVVSPLADGYNLVALEYVAANGGDGALVLSEFAGAHTLLGGDAYSINPHDVSDVAGQIAAALHAPASERRARMRRLTERVETYDIERWLDASVTHWLGQFAD